MRAVSVCQGFIVHVFLVSLFVSSQCFAKLVNATIDDGHGDSRTGTRVDFSPQSAWRDGRVECSGCTAKPNSALLYNRTWHDNTFIGTDYPYQSNWRNVPTTASVRFTGVAVYVYCATGRPNDPENFATRSDMTFYIDGQEVGTYVKEPPGGDGFDYDVLVFKKASLSPGEHEFILQNGRPDGLQSLVLLDRIVYTYDDGNHSKPSIGPIVGGVVGGIAVLAILVLGIMIFVSRRRRRHQSALNAEKADPYPIPHSDHHHHHHHMRGAPSISSNVGYTKNTYQSAENVSLGAGSSDTGSSGIHPQPQTFNRLTRLPMYEEMPPPPPPPPSLTAIPSRQVKFGR